MKHSIWNREIFFIYQNSKQINQEEKENVQRQKEKQIQVEVSKVTSSYEQKLSSLKAEHEAALEQSKLATYFTNNLFFFFSFLLVKSNYKVF